MNTQNRLTGYTYDAAGNLTNDGNHSYTYDAENRVTKVDGGSTATYVYDADGNRAQKTAGATVTQYVLDTGGNVLQEVGGTGVFNVFYIYFAGQLAAEYTNNTTYFFHADHLGSTRLMTKMDKSVYDNLDYLPYGEQVAGDTGTTHKFTGKERDAETGGLNGNDYFGARYYTSNLGRFISSDPRYLAMNRLVNPQRWNTYAYALNSPFRYFDPDGRCLLFTQTTKPKQADIATLPVTLQCWLSIRMGRLLIVSMADMIPTMKESQERSRFLT